MSYWKHPAVHVRTFDGVVHWSGGPWLADSKERGYFVCGWQSWDVSIGDKVVTGPVTCLECLTELR